MSDSLNQLLWVVVVASFGVISFRAYRRWLRSRAVSEREVSPFAAPVHDMERPIARSKEHPVVGQLASSPSTEARIGNRPPRG